MGNVCAVPASEQGVRGWQSRADDGELCRIRGEFLEMPGLCLTRCQAQRLWGLPCDRCDALLTILIEERFLTVTRDGRFVRFGSGR